MSSLLELGRSYEELPKEHLAGVLVMTSVPDRPVKLEQARDLLVREGLDATLVPAKRPEVFDFQQACRSVETRRGKGAGARQMVTVGEVVTNGDESVYQITAETRDETNRVIDHAKGMRVVYDKALAGDPVVGDDPIHFEPIDDETLYRSLSDLGDRIKLQFFATRGKLPGPKVREILRTSFKRMHATRWANSVHFVPMAREPEVQALRTVVKELYGADAIFDVIPLPNTAGVRDMLEDKIALHVKEDAHKLIAEVARQLRDGQKVSQSKFDAAVKAKREIAEHAAKMQEVYGGELDAVTDALGLIDDQLLTMYERVEA